MQIPPQTPRPDDAHTCFANHARTIHWPLLLAATVLLTLAAPRVAQAGSATWDGGTAGNWGNVLEWVGDTTFPNGVGEVATFDNSSTTNAATILLATGAGEDASITIGSWSKSAATANRLFTLNNVATGTGMLIFDVTSGNASYSNFGNSGNTDTFNVQIQLNDTLRVSTSNGSSTAPSVSFTRVVSGSGGILKTSSGTGANNGILRLMGSSGPNTFTGGVTVNHGTVSAEKDGALGTGDISVSETSATTTATLSITTGVLDAIGDSSTLSLSSFSGNFATVSLASGIDETIGGLFLDGIAQSAGTWGSTTSGATFTNDSWFSGTGIVTVVPEPSVAALISLGCIGIFARRRSSCGA